MTDPAFYRDRLHERLPQLLRGGPNLRAVLEGLGRELSRMDAGVKRLMRSRWYLHARGWDEPGLEPSAKAATELGRIGAQLGLYPDPQEPDPHYRRRLHTFVQIHRSGLGTAPALLRLAALEYGAVDGVEIHWRDEVAVARFTLQPASAPHRRLQLELEDNPPRRTTARFEQVAGGTVLTLHNLGLRPAVPLIELTARETEVAVPLLVHQESGIRILFLGRIPPGATLVLGDRQPPLLNREYGKGTMLVGHGFRFGDPDATFHTPEQPVQFADFTPDQQFPRMPAGECHWSYRTLGRAELETYLAGREGAAGLVGLALEPPGDPPLDLAFTWTERKPASFVLRVPADYVPPHMRDHVELERRLNRVLDYGRAAGVQARLELVMELRETQTGLQERPLLQPHGTWRDSLQPATRMQAPEYRLTLQEPSPLGPERFGTSGICGNAWMDHAVLDAVDGRRAGPQRERFDSGRPADADEESES